jgi:hypothetical protein
MRTCFRKCVLFSLLMLCGMPVCLAQSETEDPSNPNRELKPLVVLNRVSPRALIED